MASDTQNSPFIKQLASSDKRTRDEAFERLQTYLRSRKSFDELELLKLWKGLFYCMWMQDKPRAQQRLARDMASLIAAIPRQIVMPFLSAFWTTIAREWPGVDALRMNKFLYLIRQYVGAAWILFAKQSWKNTEELENYMHVIEEGPLSVEGKKVPDGLRYHVLDVWVDELDRVDEGRDGAMPIERFLQPVKKLSKESRSKGVRARAKETLEDERLEDWNGEKEQDVEEWGGFED